MRHQLETALDALYDYEYIDLDKFYNDSENARLLESLESGDKNELKELWNSLQHFLDFETNYNLKIDDMLSNINESVHQNQVEDFYGSSSP